MWDLPGFAVPFRTTFSPFLKRTFYYSSLICAHTVFIPTISSTWNFPNLLYCFWALSILLSPAYNFKTQLRYQHLLEAFPNYPTLQWRDTHMYTILVILHLPGLMCSGGWRELVESRDAVQWAQHPQGSISLIGLHKHLLEWLEYPESFWVDPSSWVL